MYAAIVTTQLRLRWSEELPMPQQEAGSRSDKLLSDQKVYVTRRFLIVRRMSHKRCAKSYIALFSSNTHLRWFYSLVNNRYYSLNIIHQPTILS